MQITKGPKKVYIQNKKYVEVYAQKGRSRSFESSLVEEISL